MADPVPAGSDVSAGTYKCTRCGYELRSRPRSGATHAGVPLAAVSPAPAR